MTNFAVILGLLAISQVAHATDVDNELSRASFRGDVDAINDALDRGADVARHDDGHYATWTAISLPRIALSSFP